MLSYMLRFDATFVRALVLIIASSLACAGCATTQHPTKQRQRQALVECLDQNGWQQSLGMRGQLMMLNPNSLNIHRYCRALARSVH